MNAQATPQKNQVISESRPSELLLASQNLGNGSFRTSLSVPGMHCGGCMSKVEKVLSALPQVRTARVNLSTRCASVEWSGAEPPPLIDALSAAGFDASFLDEPETRGDPQYRRLVRAMAVAGFAAANIMALSVAVWAGADAATRDLFHWLSAAIALPTLIYSGRIFFEPALKALRHGKTNMDVPISIGVVLAFGLSLFETAVGGQHAYFDAAVTLLFFLLIGRTLDHAMREKARGAVKNLAALTPRGANVIDRNGRQGYRPVSELTPGLHIALAAGERFPVDARIVSGHSLLDCAMVSGESEPVAIGPGDEVRAGTVNLTTPIVAEVTASAKDSFLSEMIALMETAEGGRNRYRRLADRVSSLYSPVVHLAAAATGLSWLAISGDWHVAVTTAVAVLIITCPCALGLAVPIVHVVAARRLFENGILVKDGSAMERLNQADTIVFDKTGTLTQGRPVLRNLEGIDPDALAIAGALASRSQHPLSQAIAQASSNLDTPALTETIQEFSGLGMQASIEGKTYRLGQRNWACRGSATSKPATPQAGPEVVLSRDGAPVASFAFKDRYRDGASGALAELRAMRLEIVLLSGDREEAVARAAHDLGIERFYAQRLPSEKVEVIAEISKTGRKVLMVGDGLNDAPSLAAAHVSIAPSTAADIGRQAADLVFTRSNLSAVPTAVDVARRADVLVRQNLIFSLLYNLFAVPLAMLGMVTPLVAALAMSFSSTFVVLNALRLRAGPTAASPALLARPRERMEPV